MKFHKYLLASLLAASAMAGFSACDEDQDYPPVVCPDLGGDGKAATPLTVSGGRALYTQEFSSSRSEIPYWVTGYIVGIIDTKVSNTASPTSATFTAPFAVATNILIAQSPDCADYEDCLCVQLPSGAVRTALNLTDNPANLGKRVTIRGYFEKYCSMAGMKDCDMYNWGDKGVEGADVEIVKFKKVDGVEHFGNAYAIVTPAGNAATPRGPQDNYGYLYNTDVKIADNAFSANKSLGFVFTDAGDENVFISDCHGNYLYMAMGSSSWFTSFQLSKKFVEGDMAYQWKVFANDDGTVRIVNVKNNYTIAYYGEKTSFGVYAEIKDGYTLPILYEMEGTPEVLPDPVPGEGGGDEPTPPAPVEGQIYSALAEGDAALTDGWTIDNVNLGSLSQVWSWKEYSGKHYLNGSGYNGSAVACEAYAVSPVIDLTGVTEAAVAFDHAAKFQTTLRTLCGLAVREDGATAWTMLTIPTWPEAGSWAFANSGSVDLSAYNGKKIQIAFKYASTAEGADTWEIKNLVVTGKK